jgi:protein-S-isoprenylcysteine O-methyltransferase Ste14
MTPAFSKFVFVMLAIGWYIIRYEYARRSRREKILRSDRGPWEIALLLISLTGLGILPFAYVATAIPRFAAYTFQPIQGWLGLSVAIAALVMFHLTHRALGRNWSISLDVREDHQLVTDGIYRRVRHPMYSAFWLWTIAQALLLPNWVAGFSGLVGFGILFFGRVAREERMMLEAFGDSYRAYIWREPAALSPHSSEAAFPCNISLREATSTSVSSVPFLQHLLKKGCAIIRLGFL